MRLAWSRFSRQFLFIETLTGVRGIWVCGFWTRQTHKHKFVRVCVNRVFVVSECSRPTGVYWSKRYWANVPVCGLSWAIKCVLQNVLLLLTNHKNNLSPVIHLTFSRTSKLVWRYSLLIVLFVLIILTFIFQKIFLRWQVSCRVKSFGWRIPIRLVWDYTMLTSRVILHRGHKWLGSYYVINDCFPSGFCYSSVTLVYTFLLPFTHHCWESITRKCRVPSVTRKYRCPRIQQLKITTSLTC